MTDDVERPAPESLNRPRSPPELPRRRKGQWCPSRHRATPTFPPSVAFIRSVAEGQLLIWSRRVTSSASPFQHGQHGQRNGGGDGLGDQVGVGVGAALPEWVEEDAARGGAKSPSLHLGGLTTSPAAP